MWGLAQIFYLDQVKQPLLCKHIDGLPALYLDCDKDLDFERDQAAKITIARHVKEFSEHVRSLREARYHICFPVPVCNYCCTFSCVLCCICLLLR